ncbi:hypothetical protein C8J57DRAFT_114250 [Mycena rebaudengoi]|nr:hypothetical protein C8J57DRAFT_114250 [Mycena rebaudengoi]
MAQTPDTDFDDASRVLCLRRAGRSWMSRRTNSRWSSSTHMASTTTRSSNVCGHHAQAPRRPGRGPVSVSDADTEVHLVAVVAQLVAAAVVCTQLAAGPGISRAPHPGHVSAGARWVLVVHDCKERLLAALVAGVGPCPCPPVHRKTALVALVFPEAAQCKGDRVQARRMASLPSHFSNPYTDSSGSSGFSPPEDTTKMEAAAAAMHTERMTPLDVLSSVIGSTLAQSELEDALAANGYNFARAIAWLVDRAVPARRSRALSCASSRWAVASPW